MFDLRKRFAVSGTGLEKLLEVLKAQGFSLYNVRRSKAHCLEFSAPVGQCGALREYIEQRGFSLQELPAVGPMRFLATIRQRRLLGLFAAAACCVIFFLLQFIWNIQISGAGIYRGEINQWLQEQGIGAGSYKNNINLNKLCEDLLFRLPHITWVRAQIQGFSLKIDITEGIPFPDTPDPGKKGNIVAACDGVIQTIDVFSGTAAVSPGETVREGQVLIRGAERNGPDDSVISVQARGKITARTWKSADASVEAAEYASLPTGRTADTVNILTPWFSVFPPETPDFLTFDAESRDQPVGGAWIPVWVSKTRYTEIYLEEKERNMEAVKEEAGRLAMHHLLLKCGKNDVIIDKWLNFSMIEGDTIQATATAELIADIGRFAPQITD